MIPIVKIHLKVWVMLEDEERALVLWLLGMYTDNYFKGNNLKKAYIKNQLKVDFN